MTVRELARTMILDVLRTTGITATAGIGTNLYLCKVAMNIMAKHVAPDESGVRTQSGACGETKHGRSPGRNRAASNL